MTYAAFLLELYRFGLITEEQAVESYREYQRGIDEHDERMEAFKREWQAEYDKRPWWRRWMGLQMREYSWMKEWYEKDIDERYPPDAEEIAARKILNEAWKEKE